MFQKTHTLAVAALALAALTGCGGAATEARGSHTYEPLPPLSTATPSPTPKAISSPSPKASPTPSPTPSASPTEAPEGGVMAAGVPGQAAGSGAFGAPAPPPVPAPVAAPVPAPVSGPVGGGAPGQMTERTTSTTTTVTSTTLEARVQIVVACEGLCMLGDLSAPELTGGDGPVSPDLLRQALGEELGGQGGDQQRLTDELIEQLTKGDWDLADTLVQGGDEKLIFSSTRN